MAFFIGFDPSPYSFFLDESKNSGNGGWSIGWSMKEIVCFVKIGAAKKDCFLASNVEHLGICTFLDDLHQPKKANFMQNDDDWILPGWTSWTIFQRVAKIITLW